MNKLLVILGPTAVGKSELAITLAKKFQGEIISADSRQVYKGLNIGSGKVPKDKDSPSGYYSHGILHHLLDVADPQEYFSVAQYQQLAHQAITSVQQKGKLPIVAGGTGMYISALIEGWQFPAVAPNPKLREQLEKKNISELLAILQKLDPLKASSLDLHNKRRIIRAIEIANQLGRIPPLIKKPPPWDILIIGIKKERTELKKLIAQRLEKRLQEGMIEEVKQLKHTLSSQRLEDLGLEYRWINRYLEGKVSYSQMKKLLYQDICRFAKRQMTWFKKIKNVHWISQKAEAIKLVEKWLTSPY